MEGIREKSSNTLSRLKNDSFKKIIVHCIKCQAPIETVQIAISSGEKLICDQCRHEDEFRLAKKRSYESKVPAGYRHMSFSSFIKNRENETAFTYARDFRISNKGLYLVGNVGVGKTHLMFSAIKDLIFLTHWSSKILFFDELLDCKARNKNKWDIIDDCLGYDFLFIDDVLAISSKRDEALDSLFLILQRRIKEHNCKIFMTSNIAPDQLGDIRITSRICGMCDIVEVNGADKRLEGCL